MSAQSYFCAPNPYMHYPKYLCRLFSFVVILLFCASVSPNCLLAQAPAADNTKEIDSTHTSRLNLHFQTTYIYQDQPAFYAQYSGQNSLKTAHDKENSMTATLMFGAKLWKGAEIVINPEIAGGEGLSGAYGMAASTNGETFRVGDPAPALYLARGYFTQTFRLGKSSKNFVPEGANEPGGMKPVNYVKILVGKTSLGDLFDNNTYSNSPRTQFINWCLMNNGAWDYAANLRGYTDVFAVIVQNGAMAYKAALAALPVVANGLELNTDLSQEYSLNMQVERAMKIHNRPLNTRLLGYLNNGDMGNYTQAIQNTIPGNVPNVVATRQYGRTKYGFGLSTDYQVNGYTGVFMRAGWNDGINETWCFTEADEILSGGISMNGDLWKRKNDVVALAVDVNGLSSTHRTYLADGGLGFQLGDGGLSYAHETLTEIYYCYKVSANNIWLTTDYQFALNPGYNSVRGPVNVFTFRVHVEL